MIKQYLAGLLAAAFLSLQPFAHLNDTVLLLDHEFVINGIPEEAWHNDNLPYENKEADEDSDMNQEDEDPEAIPDGSEQTGAEPDDG